MHSHASRFPSSLPGKLISELVILLLWVTGCDLCSAFAQSSGNSTITHLLPRAAEGHSRSEVELANAYFMSNRPEEAFRWYRLGARCTAQTSSEASGSMDSI